MARPQPIQIRVDDETRDRWTAAARDAGYQLHEYVRAAVDAQIDTETRPPPARRSRSKKAAATVEARAPRTGLCEHRIPPTSHCSRCDP